MGNACSIAVRRDPFLQKCPRLFCRPQECRKDSNPIIFPGASRFQFETLHQTAIETYDVLSSISPVCPKPPM